jgi:hypothetical protein
VRWYLGPGDVEGGRCATLEGRCLSRPLEVGRRRRARVLRLV